MSHSLTHKAQLAEQYINFTQKNIFLTGKAGTGKTTFLKHIVSSTHKKCIVAAPTGIAALNAGGVTLHSQFQLPPGGFIPENRELFIKDNLKLETRSSLLRHMRMSDAKRNTLREMELLIVDEVSMLRADLLDAIDCTLQHVRRNNLPFGGVQVLFIGDLLQLPPVTNKEEWNVLSRYYSSPFFFDAHVLHKQPPVYIELDIIFRQSDAEFTNLLNNMRYNRLTADDIELLNRHYYTDFEPAYHEAYITLTTHNRFAEAINSRRLTQLDGDLQSYEAKITGEFPENLYPCETELQLKTGAQVMFIKNDPTGAQQFFNCKLGWVKRTGQDFIQVECDDGLQIEVPPYEWEHIRYEVDEETKEIKEQVLGTFTQYPLRLAWAITIHKSQGLTFEKAILDVANVFASGQSYVAFSRLKSLSGLVLSEPYRPNQVSHAHEVMNYEQENTLQKKPEETLKEETRHYLKQLSIQVFDFSSLYKQWHYHLSTYDKTESHSEKQKHRNTLAEQLKLLLNLEETSKKFLSQLHQLFSETSLNYEHIQKRLSAAFSYYEQQLMPVIKTVVLLRKKMEHLKRTKSYVNELNELDAQLMRTLYAMKKACQLCESLTESHTNDIDRKYYPPWRAELDAEKPDPETKAKPQKVKGETYLHTLALFREGKTLDEIAVARQLSQGTIGSHFARLIKMKKLHIDECLSADTIKAITAASVNRGNEVSSGSLFNDLGGKYSYAEIRMVLAFLQQNGSTMYDEQAE
ncbi:MAG: helix-turn-helix domain-containing protein [Bacteroidota bacterium]